MLRSAFKMALRQTEGLMASVLTLMKLKIAAPDHTTVGRRSVGLTVTNSPSAAKGPQHVFIDSTGLQVFGAGQWLDEKHGAKSRRTWRKLHLAVDADTGMIAAQVLTDQHTDDPSQVSPLLDQIDEEIDKIIADGVYDGAPTYQTIAQYGTTEGRLGWQEATGYGQRALVETTVGRYKSIIDPRLRARRFEAQQTEAAIAVAVLNRMLAAGRPNSVSSQKVPA